MANIITDMFNLLKKLLFQPTIDHKLCDRIFTNENTIDKVHADISRFLALLLQNSSSREVTETTRRYIHVANEYESIADYCEMTAKYALRKEKEGTNFSEKAAQGLADAHQSLHEYLVHCTRCFVEENEDLLIEAVTKSKSIQKLLKNLRKDHLDRLNRKECEVMAGLLYTDILSAFNNIRTHAFGIVEATAGLR
jgi:phosphate:Na+ symporter